MDNRPPWSSDPTGSPRRPSATPRPQAGQPRRPQVPPRAADQPRGQEPPRRAADQPKRAEPPRRAVPPHRPEPPRRTEATRGEAPGRPRPVADRATVRTTPATTARTAAQKPPARPRPESPPPRRPSQTKRGASVTGKVFVGLLSAIILVVTGVAWQNLTALTDGLTKQDLNLADAGEKPADGAIDILLVGMDSRTDAKGNPLPEHILRELQAGGSDAGGFNTDTLIMLHIPNDTTKAFAVSFPRDSYVKIAGGYGRHKINSAYSYAKNAAAEKLQGSGKPGPEVEMESRKEGAKNLIGTIEGLTGSKIDHYAEVNLVGFYEITKAIGGVDVCLNQNVRDSFSGANFKKGPQTIEGRDALAFVRQRHGLIMGDLDRVVRQQVFMAGLAKKMLSAGVLTDNAKRSQLIKAVSNSIVLDDGWDITRFALQMKDLTGGNMSFQTIPTGTPELQTEEDGVAIEVNEGEVRTFVKNLGKDPASTAPDPKFDNATVTVDVRNASGIPGLAGSVLQSLVGKGFVGGQTGNADNLAKSVVRYGKGGEAGANAVQKALGGMKIEEDVNIQAGRARVFLGSDYSGPGANGFAGKPLLELDGARRQPAPPADAPITADGVRCVN